MSLDNLNDLYNLHAFAPTRPSREQTSYHVPFDQLTNSSNFETQLLNSVNTRAGNYIAVEAASGEGKSSLLAYTLGGSLNQLDETIIPVRVPIGSEQDKITSDVYNFYRYLLGAIGKRITEFEIPNRSKKKIQEITDGRKRKEKKKTNSFSFSTPSALPSLTFSREVQTTTSHPSGTTLDSARRDWDRLTKLFKDHKRELLIYFDDTDAWIAGPSANRIPLAQSFFSGPLTDFFRNSGCITVVAIHSSYCIEDFYQNGIAKLFTHRIKLPRFDDPERAFDQILGKRIQICLKAHGTEDIFGPGVLTVLGDYYLSGKPLRDVLQVTNTALAESIDRKVDLISKEIVQLAIAELAP